jgi:small GTP-binding protein
MAENDGTNSNERKIVFLGDSGVGKSTIIQRYIESYFEPDSQPTIGAMYFSKEFTLNNRTFKLNVTPN